MNNNINLTMLTDFYEITMSNGYFENNLHTKETVFDMFFRRIPDNGGFAIAAGLEQLIDYLKNLKFTKSDIDYLKSKQIFSEAFLNYLQNFKFTCDVWAVKEGTPVFPHEPLVIVKGPAIQAQFIETMLLLTINHQSLIATKANRIVRAANGKKVLEFGARRAQGYDGAIYGARAAFIGGCFASSNTITERDFNIPTLGTMAHSWIQMFPTELEAFRTYANTYPSNCTFLIDTYNVLKSGLPNAIKIFNEVVVPKGFRPKGVRIDSGDIAYLSIECRKMLDEAGFSDCQIVASNSLDEFIIRDLISQGAKIDTYGVGERLITSKSEPVFGGVYKLTAVFENTIEIPKIKLSENIGKITNPGFKNLWRIYDKTTNKALADVITKHDEIIDVDNPYEIFHPEFVWKKKTLTNFRAEKLLVKIFEKGKCIYNSPTIQDIQKSSSKQIDNLWDEIKRFENPHTYFVDLSKDLWNTKQQLLNSSNI